MSEPPPPAVPPSPWATRIVIVLLLAVAAPIAAVVLYSYPPDQNTFYPGCTFNRMTGLHCPGCGATRCVHALLHLDFEQALAWNPLFAVTLPFLLFGLTRFFMQLWTGKRPPPSRWWPRWGTRALLAVIIAFWILRNIPCEPFSSWAPHKLNRSDERVARGEP